MCCKHSISALNPFEMYLLDNLPTSCMGFTGESFVFNKTTVTKQLLCGQGSYISVRFSFCIWIMTIFHFCIETFTKIIRMVMLWQSSSYLLRLYIPLVSVTIFAMLQDKNICNITVQSPKKHSDIDRRVGLTI